MPVTNTLNSGNLTGILGNPIEPKDILRPIGTRNTGGRVIFKRRIRDEFKHAFGFELWFYLSANNIANSQVSFSLYNRDGTNIVAARLWVKTSANPVALAYLDSTGTWQTLDATVMNTIGTTRFDEGAGSTAHDAAGDWNYLKMVADFRTRKWTSVQFNDRTYPNFAGTRMLESADAAVADLLHFSVELSRNSSVRAWFHIAQCVGTIEDQD